MPADFTWKQGASAPTWNYTLARADGSTPSLASATVTLNLRALSSPNPLALTGTTTITSQTAAQVAYTPSIADTATAGEYMATWTVTYGGGGVEIFPQTGYLWVTVEPNLTTAGGQQIVSLPDVKEYLNVVGADHSRDAKLIRYINAATVLIENAVGPVVLRTFEEWHAGGQYFVQLRRRPSFAIGASPILTLMGCDEYRGPIKYTLAIVTDPAAATTYSCMLDQRTGTVYRRTTGGGLIPFSAGPWGGGTPDGVHVIYQAGQSPIPANVQEACLEAIRVNYQSTQATGTGSRALADDLEDRAAQSGPYLGFYLPRRCLELLAPMRRHPSVA